MLQSKELHILILMNLNLFLKLVLLYYSPLNLRVFFFALFVCFLNHTVYGAICQQRQKQHFKINPEIPGVFCQFARLLFLF